MIRIIRSYPKIESITIKNFSFKMKKKPNYFHLKWKSIKEFFKQTFWGFTCSMGAWKQEKTPNAPGHCKKRNWGICGILVQGHVLFSNDIVKTCQTLQIKWDLLIIFNAFKINLVIYFHSNNAHQKKKKWCQTQQFQKALGAWDIPEASKMIFKVSPFIFYIVYKLFCCEFAVSKAPISTSRQ